MKWISVYEGRIVRGRAEVCVVDANVIRNNPQVSARLESDIRYNQPLVGNVKDAIGRCTPVPIG